MKRQVIWPMIAMASALVACSGGADTPSPTASPSELMSPSPSAAAHTPTVTSVAPSATSPQLSPSPSAPPMVQTPTVPVPTPTRATSTPTETVVPATPTPTATPTEPLPITWHREVGPLMERSCQRCHVDGGVAPRPLTTYEEVAPLAGLVASYVSAGLMPPPAPDPSCRSYEGSERMILSEAERDLIVAWAEAGAPEGQAHTAPAPYPPPPSLVDPDLVLYAPVSHQPTFDAGGNEYFCFVLETGLSDTVYINGFEALAGTTELVHHMVLFKDTGGDAGRSHATDGNPADGFPCYDMEGDWRFVSAWAPGAGALVFDSELGLPLLPGEQLVLQMHYFKSSPGAELLSDQSGYALQTSRRVRRELQMVEFGPTSFTIPAGEANHELTYSWTAPDDLDIGLDIYAVGPHQHLLGTGYRGWVEHPDGSEECVVASDGWDFSNQGVYRLEEAVSVRPGDTINWTCHWDNSAQNPNQLHFPPTDVGYGLGTDDEMCFVFSYSAVVPIAP